MWLECRCSFLLVCQRFNVYLVVVVTSCCGAYRSCGWNVGVASC